MDDAITLLQQNTEKWGASNIVSDDNVTKVSIVGAGMETHPGVAAEMFEALFSRSVNIQMISTSEIKISVLINKATATAPWRPSTRNSSKTNKRLSSPGARCQDLKNRGRSNHPRSAQANPGGDFSCIRIFGEVRLLPAYPAALTSF